jgi:hypothetical protein
MTNAVPSRRSRNGTFFDDLVAKRRLFIDGLDANEGEINLNIFEDFYPDHAHFVYELLQNAEDAGATSVSFTLRPDGLVCEHDGSRAFDEDDVTSITGIHNSTKAGAPDRIGKFGVGFKSVFVYTQSPVIQSGTFSFRITKYILPESVEPDPALGNRTRFEFPFDNPKKPAAAAHDEIAPALKNLDETTLLFLSNLRSIKWSIGDEQGEVLRRKHADGHYEVRKQNGRETASGIHFLKFEEAVPDLVNQCVAIAFSLEFLPGIRQFAAKKALSEQFRIAPASPGQVAVFFTAAKETSGLRFHLHAPFVPELSRASIKDTAANAPLFEQLATLAAASLHKIRDLGLLTPTFLEILPIPQDSLPPRYQPIRTAIIEEMKAEPLTPTHAKGFAPARRLVQARASLKDLLTEEDLAFLITHQGEPKLWALGATQRNSRIDNFLSGLSIPEWGITQFATALQRASTASRYVSRGNTVHVVSGPDADFMAWLEGKPIAWLQEFYALLHDEAAQSANFLPPLKTCKIVRLRKGGFDAAARAFFPTATSSDLFQIVDTDVYTAGKSKPQQEKAKRCLADLGVREPGDAELVEVTLNERYTREAEIPDDDTHAADLEQFITLVETHPEKKTVFEKYFIFQGANDSWYTPEEIFLDGPYLQTGLSNYYAPLGEKASHTALHARYAALAIARDRVAKFAQVVGAAADLTVYVRECSQNPEWPRLRVSAGSGSSRYSINRDHYVPHLSALFAEPTLELSRLVWRRLLSMPAAWLKATYQIKMAASAESSLVHELRSAAWVPQTNGTFVAPAKALVELLPEGFSYDAGNEGLKAIQFGAEAARQSEEQREKEDIAKTAGFADATAMDRARRIAELLSEEEIERLIAERERAAATKAAVPDRIPANPRRHAEKTEESAKTAPDRDTEIRERSVSLNFETVKEQADQYLPLHYRNADGDMTCQICKGPVPFALDDGSGFFEAVEFIPGLKKRHFQNYLALCPNHSAMYRHANGSKEIIRALVEALPDNQANELDVTLARRDMTIYLSAVHVIDIKAVLRAEVSLPAPDA